MSRVLFVCDALEDGKAGALVAAHRLIEALHPHHDVRSVGVGGDVAMSRLALPGVDGLITKNGFVFARPDPATLMRAIDWADVVHLQLPTWLSMRTLMLARRMGVPVLGAHHLQPENVLYNLGFPSRCLARWLNRRLVAHYFQKVDLVVAPTVFARSELLEAGLTTRAEVVSNGVPARFVPDPHRVPSKLFRIVTVGRHAPEKRQAVLIDAVLRMRNRDQVHLQVGGCGALTAALKRQAAPLGAQAQVGFLDDEALLTAYQQADLVVHPSEVELEGLAVAEAIACGTPVLVSDSRSSAAVTFAHDARFIFRASDAQDLAQRLDSWVEHRAALEGLRAAHAQRGAQFRVCSAALAMSGLYEGLIASHHTVSGVGGVRPPQPSLLRAGASQPREPQHARSG